MQSTTEEAFMEVLDFPPMEWQALYDHCDQQHHPAPAPTQWNAQSAPQTYPAVPQATPSCGVPCSHQDQQPPMSRWYDAMNLQSAGSSPSTGEQLGQVDAEWRDPRTGHYSSFGKIRPITVMTSPTVVPFDSLPPTPAIRKRHKKSELIEQTKKKRKLDPQLVKTMADHLSGTAGLEKIRWQSILQNTRGSEVGERETQRRVKEVEILWLRLFGGDLRDLMRYVLDQHLDFVVRYVQDTLCTSKRRHKKVRENLFRVLLDVKRREEYENSRRILMAAGAPGGSSRPVNGGVGTETSYVGGGWLAPPTPELGEHSDG